MRKTIEVGQELVEICVTRKDQKEIVAIECGLYGETFTYYFRIDIEEGEENVRRFWDGCLQRIEQDSDYTAFFICRKDIAQEIHRESCGGICLACLPTINEHGLDSILV